MKLIDLYVIEVGRRLPSKNRKDIENELRSTLLDMLDDRAGAAKREPDAAMVKDLLKEYGSPEKVAASYKPVGYVVGPRFYTTYIMVLKIAVGVMVALSLVGMGIKLGQEADSSWMAGKILLESLAGLFQSGFQAFGTVTLIFAILERFLPADEASPEAWDPKELESITPPDEVKVGETIFSIVFGVLFLVLINFYPDLIAIHYITDKTWVSFPILTDVFYRYILLFDGLLLLQILLDAFVIKEGVWTRTTRGLEIALNAANIVILLVLIFGPSIVVLPTEAITRFGGSMSPEQIAVLQNQFYQGFRTVMGLVAGILLATSVKKVYDLLK